MAEKSDVYDFFRAEQLCKHRGDCKEVIAILDRRDQDYRAHLDHNNQMAMAYGLIVLIIGVGLLASPFVSFIRRIRDFLVPKVIIAIPPVVITLLGFIIGIFISFGSCFKQSCSAIAENSVITVPAFAFVLSLPLFIKAIKSHARLKRWISRSGTRVWIVIGALFVALSVIYTVSALDQNRQAWKVHLQSTKSDRALYERLQQ